MVEQILSLLWVLACVILIVGMAYWFTKYVAGRGGLSTFGLGQGSESLRVLARLSLGRDQSLMLVQAGERYFLLGVTQSAISTLAEFTPEEAEAWRKTQAEQPAPPSFREALQSVLHQKRGR
ncbi:MAG: flagellar biosynthetic protein FliO [Oscillospiraceae bacterium]|nr:flagellar biosynthetic protein FliO [Oscillospiraceae bacterium]